MAKYVRTDTIEAAQWDPVNTEPARELLVKIGSKIKKCFLMQSIDPPKLGKVGAISVNSLSLAIQFSASNVLKAVPGEYLVLVGNTLKVYNKTQFEKEYEPAVVEGETGDSGTTTEDSDTEVTEGTN